MDGFYDQTSRNNDRDKTDVPWRNVLQAQPRVVSGPKVCRPRCFQSCLKVIEAFVLFSDRNLQDAPRAAAVC
eukprot:scaffold22586_cov138-Cylindrotheca_fusiformis.AAC.11